MNSNPNKVGEKMKIYNGITKALDKIEEIMMGICVIAMIVLNFLNVVCRYLLPGVSFSFTEELTILLFVWSMMFAIAAAFKRHTHSSLSLFTDKMKPSVRRCFVILSSVAGVVLIAILIKAGWANAMNQITYHQILPSLKISAAWQGMALPIGGVLIICRCLEAGIKDFVELSHESKEEDQA